MVEGAPTTMVSPLIATAEPNSLPLEASAAVNFACWVQVEPLRTKTQAAPALKPASESSGTPTTAVSPSIATADPKCRKPAKSPAVNSVSVEGTVALEEAGDISNDIIARTVLATIKLLFIRIPSDYPHYFHLTQQAWLSLAAAMPLPSSEPDIASV